MEITKYNMDAVVAFDHLIDFMAKVETVLPENYEKEGLEWLLSKLQETLNHPQTDEAEGALLRAAINYIEAQREG